MNRVARLDADIWCALGAVAAALVACSDAPVAARAVPGLLLLLFLPGLALLRALLPARTLGHGEAAAAAVGVSLALLAVLGVLLGALGAMTAGWLATGSAAVTVGASLAAWGRRAPGRHADVAPRARR